MNYEENEPYINAISVITYNIGNKSITPSELYMPRKSADSVLII